MKKRILGVTLFFIISIVIVVTIVIVLGYNNNSDDIRNSQLVTINEIEQLINSGRLDEAKAKLGDVDNYLRGIENSYNPTFMIIVGSISILFIILVFLYVYFAILKPFDKLKGFASEIAAGNFDIPLNYERSNYFGKFTWAFDSMRSEIVKARKCEAEAIENNKTVIASLSHDIKTPIASINAYAEALEANIDSSYDERAKYVNVIMNKALEVKKLTDDLFYIHISELDRISFIEENINIVDIMSNSINDFKANTDISFKCSLTEAYTLADKMRLEQIFENVFNNSIKYANTKIDVELNDDGEYYVASIRDYGSGIADEDLPFFIFEKFYRGKNATGKNGTGLGLYIVKYMIEKMNGKVELISNNGLCVKLFFKKLIS